MIGTNLTGGMLLHQVSGRGEDTVRIIGWLGWTDLIAQSGTSTRRLLVPALEGGALTIRPTGLEDGSEIVGLGNEKF